VPAAKLGIGIPFYGTCWRGVTGPNQTPGTIAADDNVMSYANIMSQYHDASARRWDDAAKATYLSFGTGTGPQACTFVTYEDEQSIAAKGAYVRSAGSGGAIVWTINQGHLAPVGTRCCARPTTPSSRPEDPTAAGGADPRAAGGA
jgi:chitinase